MSAKMGHIIPSNHPASTERRGPGQKGKKRSFVEALAEDSEIKVSCEPEASTSTRASHVFVLIACDRAIRRRSTLKSRAGVRVVGKAISNRSRGISMVGKPQQGIRDAEYGTPAGMSN